MFVCIVKCILLGEGWHILSYRVSEKRRGKNKSASCDCASRATFTRSRARPFPFVASLFPLLHDLTLKEKYNPRLRVEGTIVTCEERTSGRRRDPCVGASASATYIYVHIYIIYCISNGKITTSHYMRH